MRKPLENMKIFADRRDRLKPRLNNSVLILAAPAETIRNGSVHNPFRQDSNLYYLTGWEEPGSIFVYRPGQSPETILFARKKDPERETWDGFRYGPESAKELFRMDQTFPLEKFSEEIVNLLKGAEKLYYRQFANLEMDTQIQTALTDLRANQGRTGFGLLPIFDSVELLGELRVIKDEPDLANLRKACELSSQAHIEVMRAAKPGVSERELHGLFLYQILKRGAAREGYGSIFAGGANACTLHYVFNDQPLADKQLLLVDAAGEYNYFTSDITRTYPVNGKFTAAQERVYKGVLDVQKRLIALVKPGVPFQELHDLGASWLTDVMLDLGLLSGRKDDLMAAQEHKHYYPHGIGHFLGMDVHDSGLYFSKPNQNLKKESRKIEAGMVFTIEPGLYIPAQDQNAPPEYRGIGIRIEDNILVTTNGHEVLTAACPKEVADLERLLSH